MMNGILGDDDHFAIWSDCHSVSFIHKNEKTQCKPYEWFSNVPEFEQCRFAVWKDDTLCFDDSFPNPNFFVVCDARREDFSASVRDLGKFLRSEKSFFIQNPVWTKLSTVDADLQHATLNKIWSLYQFATGRQVADAWGLQRNLQVTFVERIASQGHFDKWQATIYEDGNTGDVVHCWVDHYWKGICPSKRRQSLLYFRLWAHWVSFAYSQSLCSKDLQRCGDDF